ncbi:Crp/Fnr family transcriptional regulator [Vreelandella salicampi]|uniref:Crp/Fnr family transcriptional regulator n=1 Tax=Vreelandella salicampi TaxID=1449798 RepID=A0A7Z0LNA9_9GAMM|nr:Crp/Fnr family transcriptional regulator [Halomonas salicampi]NYS62038.1 Crp/Fnr family transcriptional regulator [Halomonas salicampi]
MGFTTPFLPTNRLIESLPEEERKRFLADCEIVEMEFGQMLVEPGEIISHAIFPLDCLVSLIATLESGGRLEVSMVGNEGMMGIPLMLGAQTSSLQALIQGVGPALRMSSACFQDHLAQSPTLERLMKRYLNFLMSQISQSAVCTHYHPLEARMARWLLMTHDRTRGDQLRITHEFLSNMLGVRRAGVTLAAKAIQNRGLISYQRGRIIVQDRAGLEEASCRCYVADRNIYDQMLEQVACPMHTSAHK